MAFTNLEKKYNEMVNKLYKGDRTKFDNGRPSTGANDDPLITRKRGDGYFGGASRALGRSLPLTSAFQDVKRITLFSFSVRGLAFLVKQQLLQTGNTFEQTRILNPLFAVGAAAAPGIGNIIRVRRHLRPITGGPGGALLKKTDVSYANVRKLGQLQKSTYDSFTENAGGGGVRGFFKKLAGPITSFKSAINAKKNVGEEFGYGTPSDSEGWRKSRPELGKSDKDYVVGFGAPSFMFGGSVNTIGFSGQLYGALTSGPGKWDGKYTTYLRLTNEEKTWTYRDTGLSDYAQDVGKARPDRGLDYIVPDGDASVIGDDARTSLVSDAASERGLLGLYNNENLYVKQQLVTNQQAYAEAENAWLQELSGNDEARVTFLKYFTGDTEAITDARTEDGGQIFSENAKYRALNRVDNTKRISYIKDPSNETVPSGSRARERDVLRPYRDINDKFSDAITVSIAMGNDQPLHFRAFIKDLQQNASPQYKDYQYIGRTEKFISYVTVQREISFKLGVLAFSKDEIDIVWKRINYLTGLVYPYGINRGIFQPNIIRLTIGNLYSDQPGYLTGLSTNFNEMSESWDIDKGVPIGAQMDMKFVLIEKKSRIASSPFYGITEDLELFSPTIQTTRQ